MPSARRRTARGVVVFFFFNDTAATEIYALPLHDALPIYRGGDRHADLRGARLYAECEMGRRGRRGCRDVECVARRLGERAGGGGERVTGPRRVNRGAHV